jgi:hypothetical protein
MLTFLFWNAGGAKRRPTESLDAFGARKKRVKASLVRLAERHRVDVLVTCELPVPPADLANALRRIEFEDGRSFASPDSRTVWPEILVLPRFPGRFLRVVGEGHRYTIRLIDLPETQPGILMLAAHLPSKLQRSPESQAAAAMTMMSGLREREREAGHQRTLVVGDLNLNPFDDALVLAEGFNAVSARHTAAKNGRTVDGINYAYFYNPMWRFFGDSTDMHPPGSVGHCSPGTCYYPAAESRWHYWNVFDQVLLRPPLLQYFRSHDLRVLTNDGTASLIDADGIPDRRLYSDHLPVVFGLNIER